MSKLTNPEEFESAMNDVLSVTSTLGNFQAPVLATAAIEALAQMLPCRHKKCFMKGVALLVKLMLRQTETIAKHNEFVCDGPETEEAEAKEHIQ